VRAISKFRSLSRAERRSAAEAAVALTRASIELRMHSERAVGLLGRVSRGEAEPDATDAQVREALLVGRVIAGVARRLPWHPTCLRQALATQRMLRRRGIDCQIHLGVTGASDPAAHAWVTVGGRPVVGGQGIERFVPLAAFR
jgi:hypothetical protein